MSALDDISDDELRAELARRDKAACDASWQRMKAKAKYFCPDCGGPDSWHEDNCPSDTSE